MTTGISRPAPRTRGLGRGWPRSSSRVGRPCAAGALVRSRRMFRVTSTDRGIQGFCRSARQRRKWCSLSADEIFRDVKSGLEGASGLLRVKLVPTMSWHASRQPDQVRRYFAYLSGRPFDGGVGSHGYPDLSIPPSRGHGTVRPGTDGWTGPLAGVSVFARSEAFSPCSLRFAF
jgi:hypothetical protein